MTRAAVGYPEGRWLDQTLPRAARVASPGTMALFTPRPFVVLDPMLDAVPPLEGDERLLAVLHGSGTNTLVTEGPTTDGPLPRLVRKCGVPFGPERRFPIAGRAPGPRFDYEAQAYWLRDEPKCGAARR